MIDLVRQHLRLALSVIDNPPANRNHVQCLIYWSIQEAVDMLEQNSEQPTHSGADPRPLSERLDDYPYLRWYLRGSAALADCEHLHENMNIVARNLGLVLKRLPVSDDAQQAQPSKRSNLH